MFTQHKHHHTKHDLRTVVCVHDCMNKSIQNNGQVDIAVVVNMGVQPVKEKDRCVMVNVQK